MATSPTNRPSPNPDWAASVPADITKAIGTRLRRARKEAGVSQAELGGAIGHAPSVISAFESGERRLRADDLVRISVYLGKPTDYFLPGPSQAEAQSGRRVGVRLRAQLEKLPEQELTEQLQSFLDYAEVEAPASDRIPDLSHLDSEKAAKKLLQITGSNGPSVDLDQIARAIGVPIIPWHFPDALSALLVDAETGGFVIGVNREHHPNRRRFSIAHELGHGVLRHKAGYYLEFTDYVSPLGEQSGRRAGHERQANQFAAALLMPKQWLRSQIANTTDVTSLAAIFRVSSEAMSFRLHNLGLV